MSGLVVRNYEVVMIQSAKSACKGAVLTTAMTFLPYAIAFAETAEHAAEGGKSGGLPQMNPATMPTQVFWLVVIFVSLYVILSKVAIPRLEGVIQTRADRIKSDLSGAENLKTQAEKLRNDYESAVARSRAQALGETTAARDAASKETSERQAKAAAQLTEQAKAAEARILEQKRQALGEIKQVAAEVAAEVTSKLLGVTVSTSAAQAAVDQLS